ncbi:MAG TPA: NAD-dependent epimerase/dehydratase family protein [Pyrinomonadaceae bacterium]|nr:NAD-dependent epimerase/dehydratase family protein [Pyrinomonadaceae bacterium]
MTHYVEAIKRGQTLRLPANGAPVRDILHVEDFARACRAFIDSDRARGLYNLGGGRANAVSLRELCETVGRIAELVPQIDETASAPAPVPFNYISDLTHISQELSWQPTISIQDGLRDLL